MEGIEKRIREPVESRWQVRKKRNAEYFSESDEFSRYAPAAQQILRGGIEYEYWDRWDVLFDTLNKMDRPDITPFLKDRLLDEAAIKLESLFLADGVGFNRIREMFSQDIHRKAWDMFFETMRRRASSLILSLARGGMLFEGLNLRGIRLAEIPEFTSCADADMRETIISGHAKNIDWSFADLRGAKFDHTFFVGHHIFQGTRLEGTEFTECTGLHFDPEYLPDWVSGKIE